MNTEPSRTAGNQSAIHAVEEWLAWSGRTNIKPPADLLVSSVVEAYAADLVPQGNWLPIASLPEGQHVLLYWPDGERGIGGIECATVYRSDGEWSYWTHGGPNSGYDFEPSNNERPTHWMPLPKMPGDTVDG